MYQVPINKTFSDPTSTLRDPWGMTSADIKKYQNYTPSLEDYLQDLIFTRILRPGDRDEYFVSCLNPGKYFIFIGHAISEPSDHEGYQIGDFEWKVFQSREISSDKDWIRPYLSGPKQVWRPHKNLKDLSITMVDQKRFSPKEPVYASVYSDSENKYEIMLMHTPEKKYDREYHKNMSMIGSINTFKMVLKKNSPNTIRGRSSGSSTTIEDL